MEMHNLEAEENIIGACLLDNVYIEKASELLQPNDFYRQAHQMIFKAIVDLYSRKEAADQITVCDELRKQRKLDLIGGSAEVSKIANVAFSGANLGHYAKIVVEMRNRRLLMACTASIISMIQDESQDIDGIVEFYDKTMVLVADRKSQEYQHISEFMTSVVDDIKLDYELKGRLKGITTGLPKLDDLTSGFQNSDYVLIGARPSVGKTALELQSLIEAALKSHKISGFFSLEMPAIKIIRRMISNIGNISATSIRKGSLTNAQFSDIQDAQDKIGNAPIYINETPSILISDLESEARRMKSHHGIEIIFIDYIGLIQHPNQKLERHRQVAEVSMRLKALARELNIPIVVASQLTRDDEGKMPTLRSLSESKQLEQDADLVIFLHRDGPPDSHEDKLKLILAKQRDGTSGIFDIIHKKAYGKMVQEEYDQGDF